MWSNFLVKDMYFSDRLIDRYGKSGYFSPNKMLCCYEIELCAHVI